MTRAEHQDRHQDRLGSYLSERQLAARWGTSRRTLQRWRCERYGPAFMRLGGSIRYRLEDILAYEEAVRSDRGV